MNIQDLKIKHRKMLVESAFRIYPNAKLGSKEKVEYWVARLLEGFEFSELILLLRFEKLLSSCNDQASGAIFDLKKNYKNFNRLPLQSQLIVFKSLMELDGEDCVNS